ncbi:hypothetical protein SteCoe_20448 [Stentor coeruleus]|uniref:Glycine cleavage system H protein n=1 Tax=Stentor coeruleus TaxID=5963 RepID=A0A1R2BS48_9CILI|nr:hypothetical protein SteCoe_20448 [Stentor coeruleus]
MLRIKPVLSLARFFTVRYTIDHEWVHFDDKTGTGTIGVTEYAQSQLGDIVHVTLPEKDSKFKQGDIMGTIESVKVVEDIYMPLSGLILDVNKLLKTHPEVINQSAESNGWIAKFKVDDAEELKTLMTEDEYKKMVEENK